MYKRYPGSLSMMGNTGPLLTCRVFTVLHVKIAEVDLAPIKDGSFILAHERNANRMAGQPKSWRRPSTPADRPSPLWIVS